MKGKKSDIFYVLVFQREKAEGANKVAERRPFDREIDLEAPRNMVTPAKRRALMDESRQSLDSKFQHGAQSFL